MGREPIGTGRLPPPGGREATISSKHRGRSPDPSKTPNHTLARHDGGRLGEWHRRSVTEYKGGSGGDQPSCLRR
jgi:hypothetical protein